MKLGGARDAYHTASSTASTIFPQLALAGVAVIWLLAGAFSREGPSLTRSAVGCPCS